MDPFREIKMNRFVRIPNENPKMVQKKVEGKPVLNPVPLTYVPPAEFWAQYNFFRQQYLTQVPAPKPEINLELELRCGPPPEKTCREFLPVKAAHGGNDGGAYSGSGFRVRRGAPKRYAPYPLPDHSKSLQLFPLLTELPGAMGGANAGSGGAGGFQAVRAAEGNAGWFRGGVGVDSTRVTTCKKPDWNVKL